MDRPFHHEAYALERDGGRFEYALVDGVFELTHLDDRRSFLLRGTYESAAEEMLRVWLFTRGQARLALNFSGRRIVEWHLPTILRYPTHNTGEARLAALKRAARDKQSESLLTPQARMAVKYVIALTAEVFDTRPDVNMLSVVRRYRRSVGERRDFLRWTSIFAAAARTVSLSSQQEDLETVVNPWVS